MIIFCTLTFAYVFSQFYRSFLSVIAADLMRDLSIGPAEFGQLGAAWFLAFALGQIPVGTALDTIGPRRTMTAMISLAVVGAVLFATAASFEQARLAMALNGLGCSATLMGSYFLFARNDPQRFAARSSTLLALGLIGNLAGATPLTVMSEAIGWRNAMLVIAGFTALSLLLVAALVRDPPRLNGGAQSGGLLSDLAAVLSSRALWPILAISFGSNVILQTERGLWVGPYVEQVHGLSTLDKGNAVLVMASAMAAGALLMGRMAAWFHSPKPLVMSASVVMAAGFFALAAVPAGQPLLAVLALAVIGASGMSFALQIAHAREFVPPRLVGRGITFVNAFAIGGTGLVQWLSGEAVARLQAAGLPPADVYGTLHLGFAVTVAVACALYSLAPTRPAGSAGPEATPARRDSRASG